MARGRSPRVAGYSSNRKARFAARATPVCQRTVGAHAGAQSAGTWGIANAVCALRDFRRVDPLRWQVEHTDKPTGLPRLGAQNGYCSGAARWYPEGPISASMAHTPTRSGATRLATPRLGEPGSFASVLRRYRRAAGLTHETLAETAGLSARTISDLERGISAAPRRETVGLLAEALCLPVEDRATLEAAARRGSARVEGTRPRHNLPRELTSFIGRERELAELESMLEVTPLLTLIGTGGVGKTRLALRLATHVAGNYPDGTFVVDLTSVADPELLARAVASAVGVPERPGQALLETLLPVLRSRRMLLVIDNCEHLIAACGDLVSALLQACADVQIVATSREPLRITGEHAWRVPSLSLPTEADGERVEYESVRLFLDGAVAAESSFCATEADAGSLAQICRRLDGIPLALELAAARTRVLSLYDIAARLDDCFNLLTSGSRTEPLRHQTLYATIDWSYALLSTEQRWVFKRLAVFADGFALEAAQAVCGGNVIPVGGVLEILADLVDKSLVVTTPGHDGALRYRLLETLRQFAWDRLMEGGDAADAQRAHALYFLAVADQADTELFGKPHQVAWLNRLELEHGNLRTALRWLASVGDVQSALALAGGMRRFWNMRDYLTEERRWIGELLSMPGAEAPTIARCKALNAAGLLAFKQGDTVSARDFHVEARRLSTSLGDVAEDAWALWRLGHVLMELGDFTQARAHFDECIATSRSATDRANEACGLRYLAMLEFREGNLTASRAQAHAALSIFNALRWTRGVGWCEHSLADASFKQGDYVAARHRYERALAACRQQGDTSSAAMMLVNLARVELLLGDYGRARAWVAQAIGLVRSHDMSRGALWIIEFCAEAASTLQQPKRAVRLTGIADMVREAVGAELTAAERAARERWLNPAQTALGEDRAAEEYAAGRAMSTDDALAYALLDEQSPQSTSSSTTALTARENEVLALIADGRTNTEIAEGLVLSVRTVERHIANIYAKIGARGRADATVYALRHGAIDGTVAAT
jgi:predicted ATPase/DNA-binding CsgD family transcriptional regulator/DNA-binding XRE family transcriptional regulator